MPLLPPNTSAVFPPPPLVPLSEPARQAIEDYAGWRSDFIEGKTSPWLFPSRGESGHLTRQRFGQLLKENPSEGQASDGGADLRTG
ncbi:hypothetical protein [Bdellovibrio bacteriovorus]|uniref:hypothetical protein n=1 Tax=Bdellovibrio bacteriovorus TaxID=959 RepID=UPI0018DF231A|nr:hypothetical protein [Bdellovibrio bacteriovorus]